MAKIVAKSGVVLTVEELVKDDGSVEISIQMENPKPCLLHWGVRQGNQARWQSPPRSVWPEGTRPYDHLAVQTPFAGENGRRQIRIELDRTMAFSSIDFVLFFPEEGRWDNNNGRDYRIIIPKSETPAATPAQTFSDELPKGQVCYEHTFDVEPELSPCRYRDSR